MLLRGRCCDPYSQLYTPCAPLTTPTSLQTSPVVTMSLGSGQGACHNVVAALSAMVGKFHASATLASDTTPRALSRTLVGALASDSWLSIDRAEALSLQVRVP